MSIKNFNQATNKWEPYKPTVRAYPALTTGQAQQLTQIQFSSDRIIHYWPAQATLRDGSVHDRVYFVDAAEYIKAWGVWPDDDSGKQEIRIEEVVSISDSASRLPYKFADQLYRSGESGMGYVVFELQYTDGAKSAHLAGNAVDFVQLPEGKQPKDIVGVTPHAGRDSKNHLDAPDYAWCLFQEPQKKTSFLKSLFKF